MEALIALLAPAYAEDPRMPAAILLAEQEVDPNHCYHDRVVVLLAAHMLEMADRGATGGGEEGGAASGQVVKSMSEGGLSISYGSDFNAGSSSGTSLDSTTYGQEVLRLNQLCYGITAQTGWIRGLDG